MKLNVKFAENGKGFRTSFNGAAAKRFHSQFSETTVVTIEKEADYYEGEYQVIPQVEAQILPTAKKTMKEDLTVCAIPIFNVSNNTGGTTFYIATMDEDPDGGKAILGKMKIGATAL